MPSPPSCPPLPSPPRRSPSPATIAKQAKVRVKRAGDTSTKKKWLKPIGGQKWEVRPVRALAPGRKAYTRGSERRIICRTGTAAGPSDAVSTYEEGKLAPGSRKALQARVAFWERRAAAHQVEPWPLDIEKLGLLGALLHAGAYRSAAAYFAAAKRHHVRTGGIWTSQMTQEVRDGVRSCTRGQGPDKQSAEIDLDRLAKNSLNIPKHTATWPAAGQDALLVVG